MKKCTKCGEVKELTSFHKDKLSKDGLSSKCKDCKSIHAKEYRKENKEKVNEYFKDYYLKNKEKISELFKDYYQKNKEKVSERRKKYYQKNKEKVSERVKAYQQKNKEKVNEYFKDYYLKNKEKIIKWHTQYAKERCKKDIGFKVRKNLRTRIKLALKGVDKSKRTMEFLGCSIPELKKHLESKFMDGMSWDNYGYYGWHIDHIRPCASFDLTDIEQQKQCFHYTNMQPLWAKDNILKSDKYDAHTI